MNFLVSGAIVIAFYQFLCIIFFLLFCASSCFTINISQSLCPCHFDDGRNNELKYVFIDFKDGMVEELFC